MVQKLPPLRRVLTGHDANGQSVIVSDAPSPSPLTVPTRPGYMVANVWRTGAAPSDVNAPDDILAHKGVLPPERGTVIRVIDFPPEPEDPAEMKAMLDATFREIYPDADHTGETKGHSGMHRTLTVDYAIVLHGAITAVMDEGETVLTAGDILIQRGTNHAWSNRSGEICRICFVLIDASASG
ncbi:cupin domain-containing protein [Pseudooceanicola sp.]|uniref:cupin domain-containing protein n=1 Tax=Pseudooceanicola sp. TaxID=1914328 RepID=UPI00262FD8F0|nr:cupin domain-containing protein [Pseudooceanicola sp.]MDF1855059.1 cupin domain-containing protein [Pseudooceanicola sp.]